MTTELKWRRYRPGGYRASLSGFRFAQIRRYRKTGLCAPQPEFEPDSNGRFWAIEIRDVDSGRIIEYLGVYGSLAEAKDSAW